MYGSMGLTSATRAAEAAPSAQSIVNTDFPEFPVPVLEFPIIRSYRISAGHEICTDSIFARASVLRHTAPPGTPATFGAKFRRDW